MKRYTRIDLNSIFVWIILPILLFLFSMNGVYAYFTASAQKQESTVTTAIVNVSLEDEEITSRTIKSVYDSYIVPGSDVLYTGTVVNTGTIKMYCVLEFNIVINGKVICNTFHNASGTKLTNNSTKFTSGATVIEANGEVPFELSYTMDGNIYDNTYQGATIQLEITAYAIQYAHVADTVTAANMLIKVKDIV